MKKLFFLASAFAIFCANADDWFVANTGSDDNNDGKDWDHCFATIKKGIASASDGDTVWVEDGYVSGSDIAPASVTSLIDVNKAITLRSASGYVDEANVKGATIRGYQPDGLVTNNATQLSTARRGVQLAAGASLVGFVVEKGASPATYRGGGVYGAGTSSVVSNCVVRDNVGCYGGGGLYNVAVYYSLITNNLSCRCGGGGFQCDFYNCDIIGNTDVSTSGNDGGGGGAVDANVYNCRLIGNVAKTSGGALRGYQKSGLVCRDSTICGNKAPSGGGFYSSSGTYVYTVSGCTICSNSAQAANNIVCSKSRVFGHYSGGAVLGGGTYTGCIIEDNHATNCASGGLGLGIVYSNCVIRGNSMNYTGQCYGFLTTNGKVIGCMVSNNVMTINGVQSGNRWGLLTYGGTVIGSIATNNFSGYLVGGTTYGSKIYNSLLYHAGTVVRQSDCWNSTMIKTTTGGYTTDRLAVCTNCVCWNSFDRKTADNANNGVFNSCTGSKANDPTGRSFSTDPMLDADARPLKNSPCRDACTGDAAFAWMTDVSDARSLDAFGKKRVVGTYADIGALEYLVHKGSAILIH